MAIGLEVAPDHFRFRTDTEPDTDPGVRRWGANYSHAAGWSPFRLVVDFGRNTCTFHRAVDEDYSRMLRDLARVLTGVDGPVPAITSKVESLTLDCELLGLKLSRSSAAAAGPTGPFLRDPPGEWQVVQIFVPAGRESFVLGVNDRQGSGEIAPIQLEFGPAVVQALAQVFG